MHILVSTSERQRVKEAEKEKEMLHALCWAIIESIE